jgi:hypothetical protein
MVEQHALLRNAVQVWRVVDSVAVRGNRFRGMVIGHDEDDVGRFGGHVKSSLGVYCVRSDREVDDGVV